jgi:murein DD-endopeptidase
MARDFVGCSCMASGLGKLYLLIYVIAWGLAIQGCSTAPYQPTAPGPSPAVVPSGSTGDEIALRAIALIGAPYVWGGNGPSEFDCSGLVRFIHDQLGIAVPRTAAEQYSAARRVRIDGIEPGDLLFFRTRGGERISHVAIYTGEGRFIHAPQTGRPVELRALDDEYYRPRLAGAGRMF